MQTQEVGLLVEYVEKNILLLRAWGLQEGDAWEKPDVSSVTLNASPSVHPERVTNGPR